MRHEIVTNHICEFPYTFPRDIFDSFNESEWNNIEYKHLCSITYAQYFGSTWYATQVISRLLFSLIYPIAMTLKVYELNKLARQKKQRVSSMPQFIVYLILGMILLTHGVADLDPYGLNDVFTFDTYQLIAASRDAYIRLLAVAVIDFLSATLNTTRTNFSLGGYTYVKIVAVQMMLCYGLMILGLKRKDSLFNLLYGLRRCIEVLELISLFFLQVRRKRELIAILQKSMDMNKFEAKQLKLIESSRRISRTFFFYHIAYILLFGQLALLALTSLSKASKPLTLDPRDPSLLMSRYLGRFFLYLLIISCLVVFRVPSSKTGASQLKSSKMTAA
eukprot:snap_masked-scaffold_15-processed-gene-8.39-mRNA-1 protein AED:1.00 eAED:1.00 QI:0/-1/0/0/-1/1/1/0/332